MLDSASKYLYVSTSGHTITGVTSSHLLLWENVAWLNESMEEYARICNHGVPVTIPPLYCDKCLRASDLQRVVAWARDYNSWTPRVDPVDVYFVNPPPAHYDHWTKVADLTSTPQGGMTNVFSEFMAAQRGAFRTSYKRDFALDNGTSFAAGDRLDAAPIENLLNTAGLREDKYTLSDCGFGGLLDGETWNDGERWSTWTRNLVAGGTNNLSNSTVFETSTENSQYRPTPEVTTWDTTVRGDMTVSDRLPTFRDPFFTRLGYGFRLYALSAATVDYPSRVYVGSVYALDVDSETSTVAASKLQWSALKALASPALPVTPGPNSEVRRWVNLAGLIGWTHIRPNCSAQG